MVTIFCVLFAGFFFYALGYDRGYLKGSKNPSNLSKVYRKWLSEAETLIKFIRTANPYPDLSEHKYVTSGKLIQDAINDYFYNKINYNPDKND